MKPSIHPEYGPVVFRDRAAGHAFLTRSTLVSSTERRIEWRTATSTP